MRTSQKGIDFIKTWECSGKPLLKAVRLPGEAYYTIGYGHYGPEISPGQRMTLAEAEALLRQDLKQFEEWVSAAIGRSRMETVNQNQFDALVSFAYNCGPGNLRILTAARTADEIAAHMLQYTGSANEAFRAGLTNRRKKERELFLTPCSKAEEELEMTKAELMSVEGTGDKPSEWAKPAAEWAKKSGIVAGDGKGNYGWQQPITREAMAQMLFRFAELYM